LAERVERDVPGDVNGQIRQAYRLLYGREPTAKQLQLALDFFAPAINGSAANDPSALGNLWKQYAQALLGSNESAFVD
jgi:hypothetical protein